MRIAPFLTAACLASLFATSVTFVTPAFGADPDWIKIDENQESSFFYDRNGTTRTSDTVRQVRTRVVYTDQGKAEALKVLKELPEPAKLYETRYMYEVNCLEKEGHLLGSTHFDKGGAIMKSSDLAAFTQWEYLAPGTRMALVTNQACSQ